MAFNQLKERMREHQAEMKRRSEQRKDAQELRRNRRIQVDLEPVLGESAGADGKGKIGSNASPSSGGPAAVKWEDYKDQLQRFYDDRGMDLGGFGDGDSEDEDEDDADADADYSGGEGDLKTKKKKKKTKKKRGKTGATAVSEVPEEFRKHRTEGTDVSQLPEEFFQTASAKFDVVDYVLEALPEHLDNLALIPFIQSEIERNDVFRDRVRQDLTAVVMEKYDTFVAGMQTVRDIDMDLSTADVFATNSRRLLAGFKESLTTSTLRVIQRQRLRQRSVSVHKMVKVLERAQSLRSTMQIAIKERRFADAVKAYTRAHTELQARTSMQLSAINDIRKSLPKYVAVLQSELNEELRALCFRGFNSSKYAAVLRAFLLLDDHAQKQLESQVADCVDEPKPLTVLITCPDRMGVGDKVTVRTPEGRKFRVTIPPGTEPGKQFRVTMPLSESDRDVMSIRCPASARPGQKLIVTTTKGQKVQAIVPDDCTPGTKFFIRIPKAKRAVQALGESLEEHFLAAAQEQVHRVVMDVVRSKWRELRHASRAQLRLKQQKQKEEERAARAARQAERAVARAEKAKQRAERKLARNKAKEEARAKRVLEEEKRQINPYLAAANANASSSATTASRPRGDSANPFADDDDGATSDSGMNMPSNPFDSVTDVDVGTSVNPFGDITTDDEMGVEDDSAEAAAVQNPFGDEEFKHAPLRRTFSSNPFDDEVPNVQHEDSGPGNDSSANPFAGGDSSESSNSNQTASESSEAEPADETESEATLSESSAGEDDDDGDGLSSQTLRELSQMLHPTTFANALAAVCGCMWRLLHAHYLFLQWHRDPFGAKNNDVAYLHRSAADADPIAVEDRHHQDLLKLVRRLEATRSVLWRECQQSVSQFVECVPLHQKEFKNLTRMAELAAVCGTFVLIGQHIIRASASSAPKVQTNKSTSDGDVDAAESPTNAPASAAGALGNLEIMLRTKLGTFFRHEVHEVSFRTLKEGLQREEWNLLPVDVAALGGLEAVVLHRLAGGVQAAETSRWQHLNLLFQPSYWNPSSAARDHFGLNPESTLEDFPRNGVPFDLATGGFQLDGHALQFAKQMLKVQLGVPTLTANANGSFTQHDRFSATDACYFSSSNMFSTSEARGGLPRSDGTITSSGLNLFAQFAGKYFQCMRLLPQVAGEIFSHLVDLFDYYMYAVFMTFFLEGSQEVVWDAELPVPDPSFAPLVAHLRKLSKKFDAKAVKENLKPTNELLNLIDGLGKSANAGNSNDDTLGSGGSTPQNGRPKQGAGRLGSPTSPGGGNTSTKGLGWAALGASGGLSTRLKKKDQRVSSVARLPFNPKLALESSMWGINARSVAVESMLFLSDVMWFLHPRLQCFMQPAEAHGDGFVNIGCTDAAASKRMRDFYETFPSLISQYREFFYRSMAQTMCMVGRDRVAIRDLVEKNNWTNSSDMLECHLYVKKVIQQMEGLWIRLDALSGSMPPMVAETMWAHCYEQVLLEFMEGFAAVRKCNPAGRGMMKMDLTAVVRGIAQIHAVDTSATVSVACADPQLPKGIVCSQESIDAYLNAFYFDSRNDLLEWVRDNRAKYYERWMVGLAMVGVGSKMKMYEKEKLRKDIASFY